MIAFQHLSEAFLERPVQLWTSHFKLLLTTVKQWSLPLVTLATGTPAPSTLLPQTVEKTFLPFKDDTSQSLTSLACGESICASFPTSMLTMTPCCFLRSFTRMQLMHICLKGTVLCAHKLPTCKLHARNMPRTHSQKSEGAQTAALLWKKSWHHVAMER